jgi:hypothetical protein
VILGATMQQARDMKTGTPLTWDDGNPKENLVIMLQTDEHDDEVEDDDGTRRLFCKKPGAMLAAIGKALGKVKISQSFGGTLAVKYIGDKKAKTAGFNPSKQFAAVFTPAGGAAADSPPTTRGQSEPPAPSLSDTKARWETCMMRLKIMNINLDTLKAKMRGNGMTVINSGTIAGIESLIGEMEMEVQRRADASKSEQHVPLDEDSIPFD